MNDSGDGKPSGECSDTEQLVNQRLIITSPAQRFIITPLPTQCYIPSALPTKVKQVQSWDEDIFFIGLVMETTEGFTLD